MSDVNTMSMPPPPVATAADSMHPTVMCFCFDIIRKAPEAY